MRTGKAKIMYIFSFLISFFVLCIFCENMSRYSESAMQYLKTNYPDWEYVKIDQSLSPQPVWLAYNSAIVDLHKPWELAVLSPGKELNNYTLAVNPHRFLPHFLPDFKQALSPIVQEYTFQGYYLRFFPLQAGSLSFPKDFIRLSPVDLPSRIDSLPALPITLEIHSPVIKGTNKLDEIPVIPQFTEIHEKKNINSLIVFIIISSLSIVLLYLFFLRKRRKHPLSPVQKAYLAMQELYKSRLFLTDNRLFYSEITRIIKEFFEGQFGIRLTKMNAREILQAGFSGTPLKSEEIDFLNTLFTRAQIMKFARLSQPYGDEERIIQHTKHMFSRLENILEKS